MKEHQLTMKPNEYIPLRDVVFNTLREAIITGDLAPGERLMEIALADRLGVSRTPVREAIRKLELEGLVVMVPRKGAHVASINEKNLQDVIEIRMVLEEFAIGLACERITDAELLELKQIHDEFITCVGKGDPRTIAQKDETFHDAIFRATDNNRLISIIGNLREQFYRYRMEYVKDIENHEDLIRDHHDLLEAIIGHDGDRASRLMHDHIEKQKNAVMNSIHAPA